ncbi:MAG: toll/interleukin-1 receptor domain-containing protein [Bacteroidetes bacterium]|nr:toll/interleukin-1 receptor domain-containing protein [Bacteroidota bacterium]MCL2302095.1 toll/interleukin-1 receptor domain-containing protein [Lentimicrobiaceae bacterium]
MKDFDIFISYSSNDRSIADQLVTHIEQAGYTCWIAPRNIEGGAEYSEVIEKAILKCKIFLLVFSENSANSPWVKSELNIAFSENKYLIPYKIDATPLKGTMRLLLNDKHWIANNEDENKQMNLLLSAIQNYFTKLEKGEAENFSGNPFYLEVAKQKKRKKIILSASFIGLLIVIGVIIFGIVFSSNQKHLKQYNDLITQAFSIQETSVNDFIVMRNLLLKAQEIENEIPVSQRKDISGILFQIDFKLDSIHYKNLEDARWFAIPETKHGDKQAIERYKLALQAKEDSVARNELNIILSRKGNYE